MSKGFTRLYQDMLRSAAQDAKHAASLIEEERNDEARDLLLKIRRWAKQEGIPHGEISWLLAVAYDNLGQLPEASGSIREALDFAPLETPYWRSFDLIMKRLRQALHEEELPADDPKLVSFYEALVDAGEASDECHVRMARHRHAIGESAAALEILDAVALLSPDCRGARELRNQIARELGDPTLIEKVETEDAVARAQDLRPTQPKAQA